MVQAVTAAASSDHWNSRSDRRAWTLPANHIEVPAPETRRNEPTVEVAQCRRVSGPRQVREVEPHVGPGRVDISRRDVPPAPRPRGGCPADGETKDVAAPRLRVLQ